MPWLSGSVVDTMEVGLSGTGLVSSVWPVRFGLIGLCSGDVRSVVLVRVLSPVTPDCVAHCKGSGLMCEGTGCKMWACTGLAGCDRLPCVALSGAGDGLHGAERGHIEVGLLAVWANLQ